MNGICNKVKVLRGSTDDGDNSLWSDLHDESPRSSEDVSINEVEPLTLRNLRPKVCRDCSKESGLLWLNINAK